MSQCWHQEPDQRPHLGDVEERIIAIMNDDLNRDIGLEQQQPVKQTPVTNLDDAGDMAVYSNEQMHSGIYIELNDDATSPVKESEDRRQTRQSYNYLTAAGATSPVPTTPTTVPKWTPLVH